MLLTDSVEEHQAFELKMAEPIKEIKTKVNPKENIKTLSQKGGSGAIPQKIFAIQNPICAIWRILTNNFMWGVGKMMFSIFEHFFHFLNTFKHF